MSPDSGDFIIGNAEGFVHLAIASLKAAQGQQQSFKNLPWWVNYDFDWSIPGLKPDASAHTHLPTKKTGLRRGWSKALGLGALAFLAISLAVGVVTVIRWLMHLL